MDGGKCSECLICFSSKSKFAPREILQIRVFRTFATYNLSFISATKRNVPSHASIFRFSGKIYMNSRNWILWKFHCTIIRKSIDCCLYSLLKCFRYLWINYKFSRFFHWFFGPIPFLFYYFQYFIKKFYEKNFTIFIFIIIKNSKLIYFYSINLLFF